MKDLFRAERDWRVKFSCIMVVYRFIYRHSLFQQAKVLFQLVNTVCSRVQGRDSQVRSFLPVIAVVIVERYRGDEVAAKNTPYTLRECCFARTAVPGNADGKYIGVAAIVSFKPGVCMCN